MATGRSMQLTKQIGEYLVAAELCRKELVATTFTGNVPLFDIVAIHADQTAILVQVKTIRGGMWQFNATKFMEIEFTGGIQIVKGEKALPDPEMVYVFVQLVGHQKDKFFLLRHKQLQDIIYKDYKSALESKGGKRPKNPESYHCAVGPSDLKKYEDNWDLIDEELDRVRKGLKTNA